MLKYFSSKKFEIGSLSVLLVVTFLVYFNHFDNPFFFDDVHTITENKSIQDLSNWTTFFSNADTFSSLPSNRAYRPMITLMNAIDYSVAGGLNSSYYHYHIFFWFLVLIVLVYILSKHIYTLAFPEYPWVQIAALCTATWFALHTANAETINYICARSDSFSTLCIIASLILYIHPLGRKWYLYLITMIIGIWTKQTGVMFFPILLVYILLFEEHTLITDFKNNTNHKIISIIKKVAPAGILASFLFIFNQYYLTPDSTSSTNHLVTRFEYISTQWYVIVHYIGNFILPVNLSADPDIKIIKPWYNIKLLFGLLVILSMLFIMIKTALKKESIPIAFGIAWFFIALLPTTLNPLFQIANDHRMFFPFIGLFIAAISGIILAVNKYKIVQQNQTKILIVMVLLFIGHAYGTTHRNKIWNSRESLWLDVTEKSPKNERGLMNYGLTQMEKGNYKTALKYYNKALEIEPEYYSLHINLGILYGVTNHHQKAEEHFKFAINLSSFSSEPEFFYGRYLAQQKRYDEALLYIKKAIQKSPNSTKPKELLAQITKSIKTPEEEIKTLVHKINANRDVDLYLQLSLKYYQLGNYQMSISTCQELLKIDSKNAEAYNNMCAAYNQLKKWKLAEEACRKSLEISPDYQLAKNNLKWATDNINN